MAKIRQKQENADAGRVMVDEALSDLESRLSAIYRQAADELTDKMNTVLKQFVNQDAEKRDAVERGEMTEEDYKRWRENKIYRANNVQAQINDVTHSLVNVDQEAMRIINGAVPQFYIDSYNFAGFRAEVSSDFAGIGYDSFKIYNKDAVANIVRNNPDLLRTVDVPEDERWNKQHIQNAILQGIVQGEGMPQIAARLKSVIKMDNNAAIRNARTATTAAEGKGRKDAVQRVRDAGIPQEEFWMCTHDGRTRESHILLDMTHPNPITGKYDNGCAFPGDPAGEPEEIYNCRCSIGSVTPGVDHSHDAEMYEMFMEQEYFDDWMQVKEERGEKEAAFETNKEKAEEHREDIEARWLASALGEVPTSEEQKPEPPKEPIYKTATTTKEAIELLHELGFDSVSSGVKKIDAPLFIQQVNQLSRLNATFGAIQPGMDFKTGRMNAVAYVSYTKNGKMPEIKLSTDSYGWGMQYFIAMELRSRDSGFSVAFPDSFAPIATITHEFGHMVQNAIRFSDEYRDKIAEFKDRAAEAIRRVHLAADGAERALADREARSIIAERDAYIKEHEVEMPKQHKAEIIEIAMEINPDLVVTDEMGRYGMSKPPEFFAEAFCNAMSGEPNDIGLAMLEWLRRQGYDI